MVERTSGAMTLTMPSDREIVLTRVFDAPRALVFEAMTRPEHVVQWWGPRDTSVPFCEIDLRPGGSWRFVNRAADGTDHPFKGVYREVSPPDRLVYTETYDVEPFSDQEALITATFEEEDGRTTLTTTSLFPTVEIRDGVAASGMETGAAESYDRMAELLGRMR